MRRLSILLILCGLAAQTWAATYEDPEMVQFIRQTITAELNDSQPPAGVVRRVLEEDEQGRPLSFIPGCPICQAVRQAFQDFLPGTRRRWVRALLCWPNILGAGVGAPEDVVPVPN